MEPRCRCSPGGGRISDRRLRREWFLLVSGGTALAFLRFGAVLTADLSHPVRLGLVMAWLFAAVLGSAMCVVRHAEQVAHRLGEPFGTVILTLSVTAIEVVSISAIMLHGENNPTLARDTLFAVIMIILNGMVGLCLLLGGWRHREQQYNLQGANFYLGVIIPLVTLSMILPTYTQTTVGPTLSGVQQVFLIVITVGLYCTFLLVQSGRHHGYFSDGVEPVGRVRGGMGALLFHAAMLVAYLMPVVFLAEHLAVPVDYLTETLRAPPALAGIVMAALVATPEAVAAVRAAMANHLQRAMNVFLGSVLSTVGLTIPAMILISLATGHEIVLGVEHAGLVMLVLTLALSMLTFGSGRTTVMQGAIHLMVFAAFVMLIFQD